MNEYCREDFDELVREIADVQKVNDEQKNAINENFQVINCINSATMKQLLSHCISGPRITF